MDLLNACAFTRCYVFSSLGVSDRDRNADVMQQFTSLWSLLIVNVEQPSVLGSFRIHQLPFSTFTGSGMCRHLLACTRCPPCGANRHTNQQIYTKTPLPTPLQATRHKQHSIVTRNVEPTGPRPTRAREEREGPKQSSKHGFQSERHS